MISRPSGMPVSGVGSGHNPFLTRLLMLATLVLPSACREQPTPPPPTTQSARELPLYAKYLTGIRICLDPGHGGDAHRPNYKRGPTGVREAEMNLRVAITLRDLLQQAGAIVFMTRTEDVSLGKDDAEDLRLRAEVANKNNCDLFLSIHHNASNRPTANFVSVWYHGDVDYSPASLDIARYLSQSLIDELDLPEVIGCPVLSDQLMYPGNGFAVLRHAKMPAALSEASFFTHPEEEQRLNDPAYNRREANALFLGLARYAHAGLPRAYLLQPANGILAVNERSLTIGLDDGLFQRKSWGWERRHILRDTITVRLGDRTLPFEYADQKPDRITVKLPANLPAGIHQLNVQFLSALRNANIRPEVAFTVTK